MYIEVKGYFSVVYFFKKKKTFGVSPVTNQ